LSTPMVLVEFWFRNCPYCRAEMQQFERLLKGKEGELSIISIGIDDSMVWKKIMAGKDGRYDFLNPSLPNWNHYLLNFKNEAGENTNSSALAKQLNITSYPAFFVLDKRGLIKATPASAIAYIGNEMDSGWPFGQFLVSGTTWRSWYTYIVVLLVVSGYIVIAALGRFKLMGSRRSDNLVKDQLK